MQITEEFLDNINYQLDDKSIYIIITFCVEGRWTIATNLICGTVASYT